MSLSEPLFDDRYTGQHRRLPVGAEVLPRGSIHFQGLGARRQAREGSDRAGAWNGF